jgi:hypothetical protein
MQAPEEIRALTLSHAIQALLEMEVARAVLHANLHSGRREQLHRADAKHVNGQFPI